MLDVVQKLAAHCVEEFFHRGNQFGIMRMVVQCRTNQATNIRPLDNSAKVVLTSKVRKKQTASALER